MQFYSKHKHLSQMFIFKVPNNYDFSTLKKMNNNYKLYQSKKKKFLIIVIHNN